MSKITPANRPLPPPRAKAQFGAAALGNLRAALGDDGRGEPLRVPLALIDEDPDQPRTVFDDADLQELAASIKEHGVVQPVVVRPAVNGRHVLVAGARRLRASRLAGVADIPATVRAETGSAFAAQVIENRQRADLRNSDLAAAVERLAAEGNGNRQIAVICNLKEWQITAFRKVGDYPPELRARLDTSDVRALYDLYRQWQKTPEAVIAALPAAPDEPLTITEARRIVGAITGKPTGSIVLDATPAATPAGAAPAEAPRAGPASPSEAIDWSLPPPRDPAASPPRRPSRPPPAADEGKGPRDAAPPPPASVPAATEPAPVEPPSPAPTVAASAPVFVVRTRDGSEGRLVVDRRAGRAGWALVAFEGSAEEVDPADLAFVRIE